MPTLGSLLDTTMRKVGSTYGVVPEISDGAALGSAALQPSHLATLPVEHFTPGGVALSDANVIASIEAARAYAVTQKGGRVVVPAGPHSGLWAPPSGNVLPVGTNLAGQTAMVYFKSTTTGIPLWLEGVPGGGFIVPATCNVGVYFASVDADGATPSVHHDGGMRFLSLVPASAGLVMDAFRIFAAVNCRFEKLNATTFNGASGGNYGRGLVVHDDSVSGDYNSQFCKFEHCLVDTNQIDFDMHGITRCMFDHCNSQGASYRAWLLSGGADVSLYSCGLQETGMSVVCEIVGNGYATLIDCYTEGDNIGAVLFKSTSITGFSQYHVIRYRNLSQFGTAFDVDVSTSVFLANSWFVDATAKQLKASPSVDGNAGPYVFLDNIGTAADAVDALDSSKFDVNAVARARLYVRRGGQVYAGGHVTAGSQVQLAQIAEGSEGTPSAGALHYNSSASRPRVYNGSAFRDVAYADDPRDLSKLLAPYAIDCWDPGIARRRSLVSATLDTLAGALNGTLAAAVDSSHRPVWNASDPLFLGRPSFSCTVAGGEYMIASTIPTQPIGTPLGAFIVARLTGTLPQTGNRNFIYSAAFQVFADDTDNAGANGWQAIDSGSSPGRRAGATLTHDLNPHIVIVGNRATSGQWDCLADGNRGFADTYSAIASAFSGPVQFGAYNGIASDVTIAFIALLNAPLPLSIEQRATALASSLYGVGL